MLRLTGLHSNRHTGVHCLGLNLAPTRNHSIPHALKRHRETHTPSHKCGVNSSRWRNYFGRCDRGSRTRLHAEREWKVLTVSKWEKQAFFILASFLTLWENAKLSLIMCKWVLMRNAGLNQQCPGHEYYKEYSISGVASFVSRGSLDKVINYSNYLTTDALSEVPAWLFLLRRHKRRLTCHFSWDLLAVDVVKKASFWFKWFWWAIQTVWIMWILMCPLSVAAITAHHDIFLCSMPLDGVLRPQLCFNQRYNAG